MAVIIQSGGGFSLSLDPLLDLMTMHRHVMWRLDADPHLVASNAQHGHPDVFVDYDGLACLAGQYQHGPTPWLVSCLALGGRPASEIDVSIQPRHLPAGKLVLRFTLHAWDSCHPSGPLRPTHRCLSPSVTAMRGNIGAHIIFVYGNAHIFMVDAKKPA